MKTAILKVLALSAIVSAIGFTESSARAEIFINGGTVYFSNEATAYCGYDSWANYEAETGRTGTAGVPYLPLPGLTYTGACGLPAGLYQVNGTVLESNGQGHWCGFDSWQNFVSTTEQSSTAGAKYLSNVPSSMVSDGACGIPAQPFLAGAGLYQSNGQGHFCWFDTMAKYIARDGERAINTLKTYAPIPASMVFDGTCQ